MSSNFTITGPTTKREKQLMLVAGILAVSVVVPLLFMLYGGSSATVFLQRNALRKEVETLEQTVEKKAAIQRKLNDYVSRSLPPMGTTTREKYLNLLYDQASACGFQDVKVNSTTSTGSSTLKSAKSSGFQTFSYKLTGKTSLDGLTKLLQRFYGAELLQLIKSISIKPVDQSNRMEISMDIEAIALDAAKRTSTIELNPGSDEQLLETLAAQVRQINERALFSMYRPPTPPNQPTPPPAQPEQKFTEAMYTYVSAVLEVNGICQVWIERRLKGDKLKLKIGDHLDVDGIDCIIRDITLDKITIGAMVEGENNQMQEDLYSIRVGRCINDFEIDDESGG